MQVESQITYITSLAWYTSLACAQRRRTGFRKKRAEEDEQACALVEQAEGDERGRFFEVDFKEVRRVADLVEGGRLHVCSLSNVSCLHPRVALYCLSLVNGIRPGPPSLPQP